MSGTLFVVATPIGNLEDLTPRARQTLAEVELVAAEDTRRTGRLLSHIGVDTRQIALHEHNEAVLLQDLLGTLEAGRTVALVADAGTPLISDPGFRLVRAARERGIAVVPIPGASALTAAISVAGLPTDRFCFEGFLPARQKARRDALASLASEPRTIVFYETARRLENSLADLCHAFGSERRAFLGRELTKLHEQCVLATLGGLLDDLREGRIAGRGEIVLVVAGCTEPRLPFAAERLLDELGRVLPASDAAAITARVSGLKRSLLYRRLLELRGSDD